MTDAARLRVLTFTSLYPNAAQPRHGLFVAERLRHLRASGRIEAMVVAPVPWFPSSSPRFGRYATYARVPAREEQDGMTVLHPRYLSIPKVGMSIAPGLMAAGARACVAALR
jgi:teichuronic acid biosynthesis glycosyltransferase TuaC